MATPFLHLPHLRHAILSGAPLVAVEACSGELMAAVVEAVRVAGREADVLTVLCAGEIPSAATIGPDTRWAPGDRMPGGDRDGAFGIPPLDEAEIDPARTILVVHGHACGAHPLGGMLTRTMRRLAAGRGLPGPVTLVHDSGEGAETQEEQRALYGHHVRQPFSYAEVYGEDDPARTFLNPPPGQGAAWDAARARLDAGCSVEVAEGCVVVSGGGRTVIARRMHLPTAHPHPARAVSRKAEFREIGPDGWIRGAVATEYMCTPERLEAAARLVWRGGLAAIRNADHHDHGIVDRPETLSETGASLIPTGAEGLPPRVQALMAARSDLPLVAAIQQGAFGLRGQDILRRVAELPGRRRERRDFAMTYPALSGLLADPEFLAGIDAGGETLPLVAARVGGAAIARRLVGRPSLHLMPPGAAFPDAGFLSAIGHDRLPARGDADGWKAFVGCANELSHILHFAEIENARPAILARLLLGLPGRTWAERLGSLSGFGPAFGAGDYVASFAAWLAALRTGTDPRTAFELLAGHGNLRRLLQASQRWHDLPHLHADASLGPDTAWPVPFDVLDLPGGWCLRALSTLRALVDEGRHGPDHDGMDGLAHCVASYGRRCLTGQSLIVSLRREVGGRELRHSTAELIPHPEGAWSIGGRRHLVEQHRALANADPGIEAEERLVAALDLVTRLAPSPAPEPARAEHDLRGDGGAFAARDLLDDWRQVMPADLAALPADGILARIAAVEAALPGAPA